MSGFPCSRQQDCDMMYGGANPYVCSIRGDCYTTECTEQQRAAEGTCVWNGVQSPDDYYDTYPTMWPGYDGRGAWHPKEWYMD
jgi:hypothetical protein